MGSKAKPNLKKKRDRQKERDRGRDSLGFKTICYKRLMTQVESLESTSKTRHKGCGVGRLPQDILAK